MLSQRSSRLHSKTSTGCSAGLIGSWKWPRNLTSPSENYALDVQLHHKHCSGRTSTPTSRTSHRGLGSLTMKVIPSLHQKSQGSMSFQARVSDISSPTRPLYLHCAWRIQLYNWSCLELLERIGSHCLCTQLRNMPSQRRLTRLKNNANGQAASMLQLACYYLAEVLVV